MKVLFLIPNLKNCGPVNVLLSIIRDIKCDKVIVFSLFGNDDLAIVDSIKKRGAEYRNLNLNMGDIIFRTRTIRRVIEEYSPDVINAHGIQADLLLSKLKMQVYKISTQHCNYFEDYSSRFGVIVGYLIAALHCHFNNKNDKNICCSKAVYDEMKKHVRKCTFIRNGIIAKGYTEKEKKRYKNKITKELGLPGNSILYIYLGVLSKRKNVINLIKLFKEARKEDEYLLIVGDGGQFEKCKRLIDSHIIMTGKKQNARDYLLASDIYVSNSRSEGLSMSILEAIDAGDSLFLSNNASHNECVDIIGGKMAAMTYDSCSFSEVKELIVKKTLNNPRCLPCDVEKKISSTRMAFEYGEAFKEGVKI